MDLIKVVVKTIVSTNTAIQSIHRSLRIPFQRFRLQTIATLRKTGLEWTQFQNGYFLDYYGMPHVESTLKPLTFVLDVANKAASIPGTGNERMTLTYTKD